MTKDFEGEFRPGLELSWFDFEACERDEAGLRDETHAFLGRGLADVPNVHNSKVDFIDQPDVIEKILRHLVPFQLARQNAFPTSHA